MSELGGDRGRLEVGVHDREIKQCECRWRIGVDEVSENLVVVQSLGVTGLGQGVLFEAPASAEGPDERRREAPSSQGIAADRYQGLTRVVAAERPTFVEVYADVLRMLRPGRGNELRSHSGLDALFLDAFAIIT